MTLLPSELGRASQLAAAAARLALDDAGLAPESVESDRAGVAMGTTSGEPREVEAFDDRCVAGELDRVGPEFMDLYPCHSIAAAVAAEVGFGGVNAMIPTACAAGNYAIAYAADALASGRADLMLAGGADSFSRITYTGFARLGAIAPEICQPFDRDRKGMIPGEGAAVLVLEPLERRSGAGRHGLRRGRRLRPVLRRPPHDRGAPGGRRRGAGHGAGAAHRRPRPGRRVLRQRPRHRHADQRPAGGDRGRTGCSATGAPGLPMSSIKSMLGHTMGAASALESFACALAIATGRVPPTINFHRARPRTATSTACRTRRARCRSRWR